MGLSPADKIVSENLKDIADDLTLKLKDLTGEDMQFSLCVFNPVAGSRINYISNCRRDDVANCWRSMLRGWDDGMPDIPAHELT